MKRNAMLKILNPIIGVLFLNVILTGVFHEYIQSKAYKAFEIMHEGGGMAFAVAAILHLVLNWNWVKASFFKRDAATRTQPPDGAK